MLDTIATALMQSLAQSFGALEVDGGLGGSSVLARVKRANGTSYTVIFQKETNGDWKIAAL